MLRDMEIECPKCGKTTTVSVSSFDPSDKSERKGSYTSCRHCRAPLVTISKPDGSVEILDPEDMPGGPPR